MKKLTKYLLVFLAAAVLTAAQKKDYTSEPGYIDFGDLQSLESDEMVAEVFIEEHLLRMVSKITKNEDQELSDLISGLKLIKVNAFDVNETNLPLIKSKIEAIDKELTSKKWDRIVRTRSKKEAANVYIKTGSKDIILGLVVTALDTKGEAAFVNIVGDINLETIGKLANQFDIPSLNKVKKDKEDETPKK